MKKVALAAAALVMMAGPAQAQNPPDAAALKAHALTADLFIAIRDRDPRAVKASLDAGADPNARNFLGFTALMWAASRGDVKVMDTLIARGAQIGDPSIYGTATTFAALGRSPKAAIYLLSKGAAPAGSRLDGASILMLAAANGDVDLMSKLLSRKVNPNDRDKDGTTALIYAARNGRDAAVTKLLKSGAKIDLADVQGRSALSYAAANGHVTTVAKLIAGRANVNRRDRQNATPLILAARYNGDPTILRSLVRAGADVNARDNRGKSAQELARIRGYSGAPALLKSSGPKLAGIEGAPSVREAAQNGINLLQRSMATFTKRAQCTSCHHQGLGLTAVATAQRNGFNVDEALIGRYMQQLGKDGKEMGQAIHQALADPKTGRMIPGVEIGDLAVGGAYLFGSLAAAGVPANPGLAEAAQFFATLQEPNGSWLHGFERGHMQNSYVTTTALVLRFLRTYGSEEQLKSNFERARQWLSAVPMKNAPDHASRLLGLKWAGASAPELERAAASLAAAQRADGGWSSTAGGRSDAYATGMALWALHQAGGVKPSDGRYQQGVSYLIRTQDEDGSWYINKAAMPANNYFDAGFPHGQSQYASFGATAWATMALMPAASTPQVAGK